MNSADQALFIPIQTMIICCSKHIKTNLTQCISQFIWSVKRPLWLVYPKFFPPKGVSRLPTTKSDSLSKDAIGSNIVEKLPSAFLL